MLTVLREIQRRMESNNGEERGNCENCPLVEYHTGPVFIEHKGAATPKVVIISESPAGFKKIDWDFSRLNEWTEGRLNSVKSPPEEDRIGRWGSFTEFLGDLTDYNMVPKSETHASIGDIYWTHAVKCFIQRKGESLREAKNRLKRDGRKFDEASRCCAEYLREEVRVAEPELTIMIGEKAFDALMPSNKERLIGESVSKGELIFTYHPNAPKKRDVKIEGFNYARERLRNHLSYECDIKPEGG